MLLQLLLISVTAVSAFHVRTRISAFRAIPRSKFSLFENGRDDNPLTPTLDKLVDLTPAILSLLTLASPAYAIDGPLSILAGKSASMLHPVTNLALFGK